MLGSAHRLLGALAVITFLATGVYMRTHEPPLTTLSDAVRLLYRSRHIYLLLSGLLNLMLGIYWTERPGGWRRSTQTAGSVLLLAAPVLLFVAFAQEPAHQDLEGLASHLGLYAVLIGSLAHAVSARAKPAPPSPK